MKAYNMPATYHSSLIVNTYFTKVKKGAPVSVKLDVYGDEEFAGKISLVYPTVDAATRTFPVEIKLENKDQRVRPGMFARATLNFGTQDGGGACRLR